MVSFTESAIDQKCSKTTRHLKNVQGFVQSPKYPSLDFYSKCRWRISVLEGQRVHVELLDIQSAHGGCVDELTIYYTECADSPRAADKRCLAGGRRVPIAFLACGQVDIELRAGRQVRFWIYYRGTHNRTLERIYARTQIIMHVHKHLPARHQTLLCTHTNTSARTQKYPCTHTYTHTWMHMDAHTQYNIYVYKYILKYFVQ